MPNIIIVGFPGCGKTTIGKKIAKQLNRQFVDLDMAIEEHYHATIPHLFQKYGEFVFRKCEYEILQQTLQTDNLVLSTGGGAPCHENAMSLMNARGLTIYIQMAVPSLVQRLLHSKKPRPLTEHLDETEMEQYVQNTLTLREPYYLQAQLILKGENFDLENAFHNLIFFKEESL